MYNCSDHIMMMPPQTADQNQLSDVHSSSATRSRLGSDTSSCSMTEGSGEGPPLCNGTINCGWIDISCGTEAAPLLSDPTTTDVDCEVIIGLLCCESSVFSCTTDADDAATLDVTPNMLSVSIGITTCLQTICRGSRFSMTHNTH